MIQSIEKVLRWRVGFLRPTGVFWKNSEARLRSLNQLFRIMTPDPASVCQSVAEFRAIRMNISAKVLGVELRDNG